ncbi:hypothetical protein FQA39_LY06030 [Lamprigera yunnana]|nr:hypothetical protein FQA39_LY06030 [Lamprigera yunnana]
MSEVGKYFVKTNENTVSSKLYPKSYKFSGSTSTVSNHLKTKHNREDDTVAITTKSIMAMSRSQKIVKLARKQYTESNPQSMWMTPQSNFDDQLENLEHDGDRYEVERDSCSKHNDHHIKMLKKR